MFSKNSSEAKQNSPVNACMCSTNDKNEEPLVFICESKKNKFGEIEQLHEEIFASKEFPWTALNVFKVEQFDFTFGLWWAENWQKKELLCFFLMFHHL